SCVDDNVQTTPITRPAKANAIMSDGLSPPSGSPPLKWTASHPNWYPPIPLTATIAPRSSSFAAFSTSSHPGTPDDNAAASTSRTLGPQRGQAIGSAWNLRSCGSRYSLSQDSHIVNRDMLVLARSYGMRSMMVRRGPQSVQLVNG